jgi:hypothetical protein
VVNIPLHTSSAHEFQSPCTYHQVFTGLPRILSPAHPIEILLVCPKSGPAIVHPKVIPCSLPTHKPDDPNDLLIMIPCSLYSVRGWLCNCCISALSISHTNMSTHKLISAWLSMGNPVTPLCSFSTFSSSCSECKCIPRLRVSCVTRECSVVSLEMGCASPQLLQHPAFDDCDDDF